MTDFRRCETIDGETRKNVARKPRATLTHRESQFFFFRIAVPFFLFSYCLPIFSYVFAKSSTPVPFSRRTLNSMVSVMPPNTTTIPPYSFTLMSENFAGTHHVPAFLLVSSSSAQLNLLAH